ncbi:hypothetical protein [Romboutsia ilealis]|uniref:hypothetical protein n=1 Tax=Romboutsia ilealis TaxID=1115758 RepID=UPI0026F38470|nr:hypothetical protein [Romboutsia ilealis]
MSRTIKPVSFGKQDDDILEFIETLDIKFGTYVKKLIRQDMQNKNQNDDIKELIKTINILLSSGNIKVAQGTPDTLDVSEKPKVSDAQKSSIMNILNKKK